jgi:REP element-mobilizing transposase RayT
MSEYEWDDSDYPLAYLITFRTHGTWLHGDQRKSVDRHGRNVYGTPRIELDPVFSVTMDRNMTTEPVTLNGRQRAVVKRAITDACSKRGYHLFAQNIRTNHGHAVVSAQCSPNIILNAFKANATRELRKAGLAGAEAYVWSRGGSTRYLWKPHSLQRSIEYTLYGQGDDLPDF